MIDFTWTKPGTLAIALLAMTLGACLSGSEEPADESQTGDTITTPPANNPPSITGNATSTVIVGTTYSFVPTASDPDNDSLSFSVQNKPVWASFDTASGKLSGTPQPEHVRTYTGIVVSVSDGEINVPLGEFSIGVIAANNPPSISGNATSTVIVGTTYSFVPTASDPDNDSLSFSVRNMPVWASFDAATGELSGTPQPEHVGTYTGIVISVSDGEIYVALDPFSIDVIDVGTVSVTLSWTAPTQNTDGSPLTDLAGYKIYYGLSEGEYPNVISIDTPGLTIFVVENLIPNTYYFVATTINSSGVESDYSNVAVKVAG